MPPARRLPLALAWALLAGVPLAAGCGAGADDAAPGPRTLADCGHPGGRHADGAGFGGAALDWSTTAHDSAEEGELFVCVRPGAPGTIEVHAPSGVEVTPSRVEVGDAGTEITRVRVSVEPGASGVIETSVILGAGGTTLRGPEVRSDDDGWSFREPG